MRRHAMRSCLLKLLTALSMLLFVATVALWVRSDSREDYFWWRASSEDPAQLVTSRGRMVFHWGVVPLPNTDEPPPGLLEHTTEPARRTGNFDVVSDDLDLSFAGFGTAVRTKSGCVVVPCWFVALLTALTPGWWSVRHDGRRLRRLSVLCAECGYDIRATPGRCPECGTSPAPQKTVAPQPAR